MRKSHNDEIDEIIAKHQKRKEIEPHPSFGYDQKPTTSDEIRFLWYVIAWLCVSLALIVALLCMIH
jgi:hypothetical protein